MRLKDLIYYLSAILCLASIVCLDLEGDIISCISCLVSFIYVIYYNATYKGGKNG